MVPWSQQQRHGAEEKSPSNHLNCQEHARPASVWEYGWNSHAKRALVGGVGAWQWTWEAVALLLLLEKERVDL